MKWLFVILIFIPKAFCDGGAVGNGGGFALCTDKKLYSYDYILTLKVQDFRGDYQAPSFKEHLARISSELKRLKDPLSVEFDLYIQSLFQQTSGAKYQWFYQKNLPLMWEPDLDENMPANCKKRFQAVYYFAPFAAIKYTSYKYDLDLIKLVSNQANGGIQVSYLLVHEWLWNFYDRSNFMKLAVFNKLLHSNGLSFITPLEFSKYKPH